MNRKMKVFLYLVMMTMLLSACSSSQIEKLSKEIMSLNVELKRIQSEYTAIQQELIAAKETIDEINDLGPNRLEVSCRVTSDSKTICSFYSINLELRFSQSLPNHIKVVELLVADDQGTSQFYDQLGLLYQSSTEHEVIANFSILPDTTVETNLLVKIMNLPDHLALFVSSDLDTQLSKEAQEEIISFMNTNYGESSMLHAKWDFRIP